MGKWNWLSIKAIPPSSPSFFIALIAWTRGNILIMFSFIQTINPKAQSTSVPPRDASHMWPNCAAIITLYRLLELSFVQGFVCLEI